MLSFLFSLSEKRDPEHMRLAVGILLLCALEVLELKTVKYPPPPDPDKRPKKPLRR